MAANNRKTLALTFRILGNLVAAGSLLCFALVRASDEPPAVLAAFPQSVFYIGIGAGLAMVMASVVIGFLPRSDEEVLAELRARRGTDD
jgi:hypothetical protein